MEERIYCHVCGKDITDDDNSWECDFCGNAICDDCESETRSDFDHVCKKCAKTCAACGKEYDEELETCAVCEIHICGHCACNPIWGLTLCEKCCDELQEMFSQYELEYMSANEVKEILRFAKWDYRP